MQKTLLSLAIALLIALPAFAEDTHTVKRVIDGDTIELSDGERVRLIGVDCPEFKDHERNKKNAERLGIDLQHYESYAQKAKDFVSEQADGTEATLEVDPANEAINHRDKYGRLLAYVWHISRVSYEDMPYWLQDLDRLGFISQDGGQMLNAVLVSAGYCTAYTRFDFKHKERFIELQEEAKEAKRGIWKHQKIKCDGNQDCASMDCSGYDNPVKSGYRPSCEDHRCRCMCYGCK